MAIDNGQCAVMKLRKDIPNRVKELRRRLAAPDSRGLSVHHFLRVGITVTGSSDQGQLKMTKAPMALIFLGMQSMQVTPKSVLWRA